MYNDTIIILRYLLHYADANNKSLILAQRKPYDISYNLSFVDKSYGKKDNFILNESNIAQFVNTISFEGSYSSAISLESLLPENRVGFCIYFCRNFPSVFKAMLQSFIKDISLEGILKYVWKNNEQQKNTIEFLNGINPMVFYHLAKNENTEFIKEIKENILPDEFYRFIAGYFDKELEKTSNEPFIKIFSELMRVAATLNPEITSSVISKYPFLKEYFESYESDSVNTDLVDFKRIKISLMKIHVILGKNDLGVTNSISILDQVIDEVQKNEKLKQLGLIEMIVKNQDVKEKNIFLGFAPDARISYLDVEDLITDCILECANQTDKKSYTKVVNTLVMSLCLPEKNESAVKKIKI